MWRTRLNQLLNFSRIFDWISRIFDGTRIELKYAQAPQAQDTWCMRQLVYIENCMGKSPIVKRNA